MPNLAINKLLKQGKTSLFGQKLFDRIINVELYHVADTTVGPALNKLPVENVRKFTITCPDGGVKPQIEFSVNLLPQQVCYRMTLKITNFSFRGAINIRQLHVMRVTAGYRDGPQMTFTGPIFSSYAESPNPDGVTVFEGVVVGESGNALLEANTYRMIFYKDSVTLRELCSNIANNLNIRLDVESVPNDILNQEIATEKIIVNCGNGLAVLNWLSENLYRWSAAQQESDAFRTTGKGLLYTIWTDTYLRIIYSGTIPEGQKSLEAVEILDCVKTASFNATTLHAQSLFNPSIKPGGLIYMDPHFFTGGASLFNPELSNDVINPDDGLYRVIKAEIQFSTCGSTNNMAIMAEPASIAGEGY